MGSSPSFAVQVTGLATRAHIIHVQGEVDVASAPALADCIATSLARDPLALVLDLTGTTFMDCSGISAIVEARRDLPEDSSVILRRPVPLLRRCLGILKIDTEVEIEA